MLEVRYMKKHKFKKNGVDVKTEKKSKMTTKLDFGTTNLNLLNFATKNFGTINFGRLVINGTLTAAGLDSKKLDSVLTFSNPMYFSATYKISVVISGASNRVYPDQAASGGTSTQLTNQGHVHAVFTDPPLDTSISTIGDVGTSDSFSRSDHQHKGVRSLVYAGQSVFGDVALVAGDANQKITSSGQNITFYTYPVEMYVLAETQPLGTNAGSYPTANTFQSRVINKILFSMGNYVSLQSGSTSNRYFYLNPGTYVLNIRACAQNISGHVIRLYNVTTSTVVAYGSNAYSGNSPDIIYTNSAESKLWCRITVSTLSLYSVQHYGTLANSNTWALGTAANFSSMTQEMYMMLIINRVL